MRSDCRGHGLGGPLHSGVRTHLCALDDQWLRQRSRHSTSDDGVAEMTIEFVRASGRRASDLSLGWPGSGLITDPVPTHSEPQEGPMAEEPTVPIPLDAIDLESLSDDELRRLTQLLMSERERRMALEPGPEDPL